MNDTNGRSVAPWRVPLALDEVPEGGRHFDLAADEDVRRAVAAVAQLPALPRLEAHFDVSRRGAAGLHVVGRVSASVSQTCVVTLEPLSNEVDEEVDLTFVAEAPSGASGASDEQDENAEPRWTDPERMVGGRIDLGVLATEFLILGLDPYPRKPDAIFRPPPGPKPQEGPFAALARMKKDPNEG